MIIMVCCATMMFNMSCDMRLGGVTLLRAAAKNHSRVTVICDPADYDRSVVSSSSHTDALVFARLVYFSVSTVCVPSVLWYCWLGLLTCKNRLPYNLYCVGRDVKHCSIHPSSGLRLHTLRLWWLVSGCVMTSQAWMIGCVCGVVELSTRCQARLTQILHCQRGNDWLSRSLHCLAILFFTSHVKKLCLLFTAK